MKPSIGKVTEIFSSDDGDRSTFSINYYKGDWNSEWAPYVTKGVVWTDTLPLSSIVLLDFELQNNKLTHAQKTTMRNKYKERKDALEALCGPSI